MIKPKVAVWKFTSCDGCQLSLLDCEDHLLDVLDKIELAFFLEATKKEMKGPYDISFVEGSISTPEEAEKIQEIRQKSGVVITLGACATAGGIQALRNFADVEDFISHVYTNREYIDTLKETLPISAHIKVDFELRGCPINKMQLVEVIQAALQQRRPGIPNESVCYECKLRENNCVMVVDGTPCIGPVTHAGCDALCPTYKRGCFGCYGPAEATNALSLAHWLETEHGISEDDVTKKFQLFNTWAPEFKKVSERDGKKD
jgi:coenzyme F420-reducing hydrogenase gamma subunit